MRTLFLACLLLSSYGQAAGSLHMSNAWVRATPPNARVAGAFFEIENTGSKADRLLSAQTDLAESVEIHQMRMQGDVMQMRELGDGLPLPAKSRTALKPGGIHLMLIAPKQALTEGQQITLTLNFTRAGKRTQIFTVRKVAPSNTIPLPHQE